MKTAAATPASCEALKAAAVSWALYGESRYLAELLAAREFLALRQEEGALLDRIGQAHWDGRTFEELLSRFRAEGNDSFADALNDLIRNGAPVSPAWWNELMEGLRRPFVGARTEDIGKALREGNLSIPEARERIEYEFAAHLIAGNGEEDLFTVQIANDPTREPEAIPPPSWVDGILHTGYVNLSGPWKAGKSWWALAASMSIASGAPFLGRAVRRGNVAWIQIDMPVWSFLTYCRQLREGMNYPVTAIPFFSSGKIDLKRPDHQRGLAAKLKELGTEILFIDSGRGISTVKENDSDEVAGLTRSFLCAELRDRLGMTVVLITHAAKGGNGGSRGSGEWDAAADSCLIFTKTDSDNDMTTIKCKGRHAPAEMVFTIDDFTMDGGGVVLREVDAEYRKAAARAKKCRDDNRVENFLRSNADWHSLNAIAKGSKIRWDNAAGEVDRLCGRGLVEHDSGPEGARKWRWCPNCRQTA